LSRWLRVGLCRYFIFPLSARKKARMPAVHWPRVGACRIDALSKMDAVTRLSADR
jgi:hypothetical protein